MRTAGIKELKRDFQGLNLARDGQQAGDLNEHG
jgi:hypothetical protein